MKTLRGVLHALLIYGSASHALAGDGVLEINQTCALSAPGCFPGDSGGFPVTITQRNTSYRLTSSLQVSSANATAIQVSAGGFANVSIDLNGFTIQGITGCTSGPGIPASCVPKGSGVGIASGSGGLSVRNGTIVGMGSHGVDVPFLSRLEDLNVYNNGGDGIHGGQSIAVHRVLATTNDDYGINISVSGLVSNSVASGNGEAGINLVRGPVSACLAEGNGTRGADLGVTASFQGSVLVANLQGSVVDGSAATGGNLCDDGRCTRSGQRLFYLSQNSADGASATYACHPGFHLASVWELLDPSNLVYDKTLGVTVANAGSGPPADNTGTPGPTDGWIRDGLTSSSGNCSAWSSGSSNENGTLAAFYRNGVFGFPDVGNGSEASAWGLRGAACNVPQNVWCVED